MGESRPTSALRAPLEQLGVRWFYPTDLGTVMPNNRTITVGPLNMADAPYFAYRHVGYGEANAFRWYRRIGAGGDRDVWSTRHTYESIGFHRKYGKTHPEYFVVDRAGRRGKGDSETANDRHRDGSLAHDRLILSRPPAQPISELAPIAITNRMIRSAYICGMLKML